MGSKDHIQTSSKQQSWEGLFSFPDGCAQKQALKTQLQNRSPPEGLNIHWLFGHLSDPLSLFALCCLQVLESLSHVLPLAHGGNVRYQISDELYLLDANDRCGPY